MEFFFSFSPPSALAGFCQAAAMSPQEMFAFPSQLSHFYLPSGGVAVLTLLLAKALAWKTLNLDKRIIAISMLSTL